MALGGIEWSWDSRPSLKMTLTCGVRANMSAGGCGRIEGAHTAW